MLRSGTNTAVIGKLRIRSTYPGPQRDQQRLRNILANASLSPAGLPSSAILVVRRLSDPLPSRLRVNQFDLQPDPLWQRAMVSELENILAHAVRPVRQPVPAAAAAVLFWDQAELLACMALDWLSGTLRTNWWWREFCRNVDPISSLLKQWTSSPEFVPAALSLLSYRADAAAFVQGLPEEICRGLLQSIVHAHAIPLPDPAAIETNNILRRAEPGTDAFIAPKLLPRDSSTHPWLPRVPEASAPGLSPIKQLFLAQALMLVRAPSQARSVEFQTKLLRWQTTATESVHSIATQTGTSLSADAIGAYAEEAVTTAMDANEVVTPSPPIGRQKRHLPIADAARGGVSSTDFKLIDRQPSELPDEDAAGSVFPAVPAPAARSYPVGAQVPERAELSDVPADNLFATLPLSLAEPNRDTKLVSDAAIASRQSESGIAVETIFGGCFFLLNVFLHLNLYSDFTSPHAKNLEMNIWDLLALVAAEFTQDEIRSDPLWEMLAALAGRSEGQLPGASFTPPQEWHLPSEWLDALPEPWEQQPVEHNGRLICTHPAGFPISDVALHDEAELPDLDPLHRWIGWLTAYLRARLIRATGTMDAVALLARLPGRVGFTDTYADITFSLDHYPIELRLAGLDRDPGWIPAAGRYVAFHFE